MPPKVLLINSPLRNKNLNIEGRCAQENDFFRTNYPPYSLAQLAAMIIARNGEANILDCPAQGIGFDRGLEIAKQYRADHLVINSANLSFRDDLLFAKSIKQQQKDIKIVLIGIFPAQAYQDILSKYPEIDFIIAAEPEPAVGLFFQGSPEEIPNLIYRSASGIKTNKIEYVQDLDVLPLPVWDKLDLTKYRMPLSGEKYLMYVPTRGCPYECTYCGSKLYYGRQLRKKSIAKVISELKYCREKYKINSFLFWSDTFTCDMEYAKELCKAIIKERSGIEFLANSRVDKVDEELLSLMKRAGLTTLSFGIESGDPEVLGRAQKGTDLGQVRKAFLLARRARILTIGHVIVGLPGENERSLKNTLDVILEVPMDFLRVYYFVPIPGTNAFADSCKGKQISFEEMLEYSQTRLNYLPPGISEKLLRKYKRKIQLRFNLRPRQVFNFIRQAGKILWK